MDVEVYSASRPAMTVRAWLTAAVLLGLACALAGFMVRARSRELLSPRVSPSGWNASFRPPSGFTFVGTSVEALPSAAYTYQAQLSERGVAELTVTRLEAAPGSDLAEVCGGLIRPHFRLLSAIFASPAGAVSTRLGPWSAVELRQPAIPMIVRAAQATSGELYAVSLRLDAATIDEKLYRVFDAVCQSVDAVDPRSPAVLRRAPAPK